ncbi:GTP-binding protein GEM-like [Anneissia japonica]|uniref:GTP-binding protein GEM-like n=1 Tax=Anneissia japonica TaxID=1529436 RepID=UPI001425B98A|nr:GTP-binding protein GEM-like [Anneissia japonica]
MTIKGPRARSASAPSLGIDFSVEECHDERPPHIIRVILLGCSGVGKSALIETFASSFCSELNEELSTDLNTMCDIYERKVMVDNEEVVIQLIDTPAYELKLFEENEDSYLTAGDAYLLVYSVTDKRSFRKACELRFKLRRTKETETDPIILVANKTDLERSREIQYEEGRHFAATFDCKLVETSVPLSHNIDDLFIGVIRQYRLRKHRSDDLDMNQNKESPRKMLQKRRSSLLKRARGMLGRLLRRKHINEPEGYRSRSKSCHILEVL